MFDSDAEAEDVPSWHVQREMAGLVCVYTPYYVRGISALISIGPYKSAAAAGSRWNGVGTTLVRAAPRENHDPRALGLSQTAFSYSLPSAYGMRAVQRRQEAGAACGDPAPREGGGRG